MDGMQSSRRKATVRTARSIPRTRRSRRAARHWNTDMNAVYQTDEIEMVTWGRNPKRNQDETAKR